MDTRSPPFAPGSGIGYQDGTPPGGDGRGAQVIAMVPIDWFRLDPAPLARLYADTGPEGAEDAVCRALEEISHRLRLVARAHRTGDTARLGTEAEGIVRAARAIGLIDLAASAEHAAGCARGRDGAALGATVGRLLRVGGRSLTEVAQVSGPIG